MQAIIITRAWLALLKALLQLNLMILASGRFVEHFCIVWSRTQCTLTIFWNVPFYARMKIAASKRLNYASLGVASSEWLKVQNLNGHQIIHLIVLCNSHSREVLSWLAVQATEELLIIYHALYEHVNGFEMKLCSMQWKAAISILTYCRDVWHCFCKVN
jgi:hypothetical protein